MRNSLKSTTKRFKMTSLNIPGTNQQIDSTPTLITKASLFKRLISNESSASSGTNSLYYRSYSTYSFCGKEILLKLSQVMICIICTGLYSSTFSTLTESSLPSSSTIFPIIIYVSFIIISGIICLGYVLGVFMHELLQRAFNIVGIITFFTASCITFQFAFTTLNKYEKNTRIMSDDGKIIFAQATLSGINSLLYVLDLVLSVKRS